MGSFNAIFSLVILTGDYQLLRIIGLCICIVALCLDIAVLLVLAITIFKICFVYDKV